MFIALNSLFRERQWLGHFCKSLPRVETCLKSDNFISWKLLYQHLLFTNFKGIVPQLERRFGYQIIFFSEFSNHRWLFVASLTNCFKVVGKCLEFRSRCLRFLVCFRFAILEMTRFILFGQNITVITDMASSILTLRMSWLSSIHWGTICSEYKSSRNPRLERKYLRCRGFCYRDKNCSRCGVVSCSISVSLH